jgi:hypothetical protein
MEESANVSRSERRIVGSGSFNYFFKLLVIKIYLALWCPLEASNRKLKASDELNTFS